MYKRVLLIVISLFCINTFLSVLPSCTKKKKYTNSGRGTCTQTKCLVLNETELTLHNAATHNPITNAPYSVIATDLVIKVHFDGAVTICSRKPVKKANIWSLFSTAYADPVIPVCPVSYGNDSILTYNVFSDRNYDSNHPTGSSLNDVITTNDLPLVKMYDNVYPAGFDCELFIDAAPADTGRYIFTIQFAQKDGDTLTVQTPAIRLLK